MLYAFHRISSLVQCLCKLHNFCIDESERTPPPRKADKTAMRRIARKFGNNQKEVQLDESNRPVDLLNFANGVFKDTGIRPYRLEEQDDCTMDEMVRSVRRQGIVRPPVKN